MENGSGSGFFVSKNVIVTNFHVIENQSSGSVKIVSTEQEFYITNVLAIDENKDLAILSVSKQDGTPLELSKNKDEAVGEKIYAIGNPNGLEGTFSEGNISGIRNNVLYWDRLIQITAPISPGSSGGPILNTEGKVIGIAVMQMKKGQNLNFVIPVSDLINLMETNNIKTN